MKNILTAIIALILGFGHAAATSMVESADSAYTAENYQQALDLYQAALAADGQSTDLYYNIGNAYYRLGQPGQAIVYYERALKLDPTNSDARDNLRFVNSRIIDRTNDQGSVFTKIIDTVAIWFHYNTWAWIALALFVTVLAATALYIFSDSIVVRKVSFFGGLALLVLSGCAVAIATYGASMASDTSHAVVITESSQLSTQPRQPHDRSEEAMLLHEGTKVEILDSLPAPTDADNPLWYHVRVNGGDRAWISARTLQRI